MVVAVALSRPSQANQLKLSYGYWRPWGRSKIDTVFIINYYIPVIPKLSSLIKQKLLSHGFCESEIPW